MGKSKQYLRTVIYATFLCISIFIALAAKKYADTFVGPIIPDLILDHIPYIDTSFFFYQGAVILILFVLFILIKLPKYIPFTLATVALFYLIRSVFMVTTHLPASSPFSGQDLFFSGHTGLPFLFSLIFWRYSIFRVIFIIASVIAGASVLLSHVHYTIDVLAAPFITYAIFILAKKIFKKEYSLTL